MPVRHSKHSPYFCYSVWCTRQLFTKCYGNTDEIVYMYKHINKCIFVTCILVLYNRFTALRVISLNVFPFFLVACETIPNAVDRQTWKQTMLKQIKLNDHLDEGSCTHRLNTLKLLSLLYLLQLANVLQRRLLKVLSHRLHRHVCLKDRQNEKKKLKKTRNRSHHMKIKSD